MERDNEFVNEIKRKRVRLIPIGKECKRVRQTKMKSGAN